MYDGSPESGGGTAVAEEPERQVLCSLYVNETFEDMENRAIVAAVKHFSGNRTLAAKMLGLSVRTVQRRIKERKLDC